MFLFICVFGLAGDMPLAISRLKVNGCQVALDGNDGFTLSIDITDAVDEIKLDLSDCCLKGAWWTGLVPTARLAA